MSIKAVVFDLDDTLYPELDYVKSGFRQVGNEMEKKFGVHDAYKKLYDSFLIDKKDVYTRVLRDYKVDFNESDVAELINVYRHHKPELILSDEVRQTLSALRQKSLKTGIITDGRPFQQWAKIEALGLKALVDCIIVTDELGGIEYRKPNPLAFTEMCRFLAVQPEEMVYVGDNPQKDFAVKQYLPIKTVHYIGGGLYCGEYRDGVLPDMVTRAFSKIEYFIESN